MGISLALDIDTGRTVQRKCTVICVEKGDLQPKYAGAAHSVKLVDLFQGYLVATPEFAGYLKYGTSCVDIER
jgi:hypothetical protein